jgi:hypothetical protein
MMAKATSRPEAAATARKVPSRAPFDSDSRLFGPNAMFSAKQAGRKSR